MSVNVEVDHCMKCPFFKREREIISRSHRIEGTEYYHGDAWVCGKTGRKIADAIDVQNTHNKMIEIPIWCPFPKKMAPNSYFKELQAEVERFRISSRDAHDKLAEVCRERDLYKAGTAERDVLQDLVKKQERTIQEQKAQLDKFDRAVGEIKKIWGLS